MRISEIAIDSFNKTLEDILEKSAQEKEAGSYKLKIPKSWVGKGALIGIGALGGAEAQQAATDWRLGKNVRVSQGG